MYIFKLQKYFLLDFNNTTEISEMYLQEKNEIKMLTKCIYFILLYKYLNYHTKLLIKKKKTHTSVNQNLLDS